MFLICSNIFKLLLLFLPLCFSKANIICARYQASVAHGHQSMEWSNMLKKIKLIKKKDQALQPSGPLCGLNIWRKESKALISMYLFKHTAGFFKFLPGNGKLKHHLNTEPVLIEGVLVPVLRLIKCIYSQTSVNKRSFQTNWLMNVLLEWWNASVFAQNINSWSVKVYKQWLRAASAWWLLKTHLIRNVVSQ